MIKKAKAIIHQLIKNQNEIILQNRELEWAHVFHDSVKENDEIEKLGLHVGRWAGNYAFFYVLNRILSDCKPLRILELGLGESSKLISTYLIHYLPNSYHLIIEHDDEWIKSFRSRFNLASNSEIKKCEIDRMIVNNNEVIIYKDFNNIIQENFDLYIIDGPFGSDRFSRYNIITLVERFESNEFIILFDDSHRIGEQDTIKIITELLNGKKINFYIASYSGLKSVTVIASEKFKYTTSL
jgi:hypothetical protein